ncbi:MAG: hypothetical protein ACJ749_15535 [Flavisolibacter sp.]
MKLYQQKENVNIIGIEVNTFPKGVKETFGTLIRILGGDRDFYGVSWMDENGRVRYYAMAGELFLNEGKRHNYELLTIEKGEYRTEAIHDWLKKTDCIKDVFHNLMGDNKPSKLHPCIEWYQSDMELVCMV